VVSQEIFSRGKGCPSNWGYCGTCTAGKRGFGLSVAPKCHQLKGGSSQRGAKAGGEDEVYKGHFPGQAGRVDEMGECGTMQVGLTRPLVNGRE